MAAPVPRLNLGEPYVLHDANTKAHLHAPALMEGLQIREEVFVFSEGRDRRFSYHAAVGFEGEPADKMRVLVRSGGVFSQIAAEVSLRWDPATPKNVVDKFKDGLVIRGGALVSKCNPTLAFV